MARPKGFRLSRPALDLLLVKERITMTELASASGIPLTTLSGLAVGDHGASMVTVRKLAQGSGWPGEVLFPELWASDLLEQAAA